MAPLLIVAMFEREVSCYANRLRRVGAVPGEAWHLLGRDKEEAGLKGERYGVNLTPALKLRSLAERVTAQERYRGKGEEHEMSEVSPFDEQLELTHAVV